MTDDSQLDRDEGAYEGPDVEVPTSEEGTPKDGGLGEDGTIPDDPDGLAAGHTGEKSTFEPEEDEQRS